MRYMAIDYGGKRIGLAICDQNETIASPLAVIEADRNAIPKIAQLIKENEIEQVVIGLPLNMDGSEGSQAQETRQFAHRLQRYLKTVPIHFQDERLSTDSAYDRLQPANFTAKKRKKRIDAIAAAGILNSFIESKKEK